MLSRIAIPAMAFTLFASSLAQAHSLGLQVGHCQQPEALEDVLLLHLNNQTDLQELTITPEGEWAVVADSFSVFSDGFPALAKIIVEDYRVLGYEIDVIAVSRTGGWIVIAESQWYQEGVVGHDALLADLIQERVSGGNRINELVFDADGDGFTLVSGNWDYSVKMPRDLFDAILEKGPSRRQIQRIAMDPQGNWGLMAGNWFAASGVRSTCYKWVRSFQENWWTLDHLALGPEGDWVLYSHGDYAPDPTSTIDRLEYGLPYVDDQGTIQDGNIWERMRDLDVPGVTLAVIENNQVMWARTYGELQAGTQRFVRSDSPFDAASLSKFVAAFTLMHMRDDRSIDLELDTTLLEVVSSGIFPNPLLGWMFLSKFARGQDTPADLITLRQLLSHSACLRPHATTKLEPWYPVPNMIQMLLGFDCKDGSCSYPTNRWVRYDPDILDDGGLCLPGQAYDYSGGGFLVAQAMGETLSGIELEDYAEQFVFEPLGMDDTTFRQPLEEKYEARAAEPHIDGVLLGYRPFYPWAAGGGLYTTARDLAQMVLVMINTGVTLSGTRLLQSDSALAMMTKQAAGANYGLGLSLSDSPVSPLNDEWFAHTGAHDEASTRLAGSPGRGEGIVFLINSGGDNADQLRKELYDSFKSIRGWN